MGDGITRTPDIDAYRQTIKMMQRDRGDHRDALGSARPEVGRVGLAHIGRNTRRRS
jgi:hypothetical protein